MRFAAWLIDLVYNALALAGNTVARARGRPVYVLVDLSGEYPEHRPRSPWWVRRRPESLEDLRGRLRLLAADPAVAGIVVTVSDLRAGLGAVQSLRRALAGVRAAGKRVIAYLPEASTHVYYAASIADTVIMPESGTLNLVGLALEATFLGDALARIGVAGEFEQIAEYKAAVEPFVRGAMPAPMREALNAVLDSVYDDVMAAIADARRIAPADLRRAVCGAPLPAGAARDAGLVDATLYEDELPAYLAAGNRVPALLPWTIVRRRLRRPLRRPGAGPAIAAITVRGPIHMGESRPRPFGVPPLFGAAETAGHATVIRAIRAAERDRRFGAIVLAIDSPGGSALASDLIWRAVARANRAKPVVAFLGNVAASGGYYVAAGARRIVCLPGTLTGSIGVIGGKFNVRRLAERAGVHRELLARGEAAALFSPFMPFSAADRRRVRALMEGVYERFVARVADGRGLALDAVRAVARGRVWTGHQAEGHGLVDQLGDFPDAVDAAKHLMGIAASCRVPVVHVRAPNAVAISPPAASVRNLLAPGLAALLDDPILTLLPWEISIR
jgi:protease-4